MQKSERLVRLFALAVEDALYASERTLVELVDILPVAVFVCDDSGVLERYNRRAVELWGREPQSGDADPFAEAYHRGVGLLLLVKEEDGKPDRDAEFCEEMLVKAMKSLAEAKELKPTEPRVRVYLAEVYDRAGNRRAAEVERAAARGSVTAAGLTPAPR